ncbi:MAG: helix-turn-helix domain-containing protein [Paracoccaceae bacterium]
MFSIGQLAKSAGVKPPTIRYYEEIGLIAPIERTEGGQRRYDHDGLARLAFIRQARDLGLSIAMIRDLISVGENRDAPCARAHELARTHLDLVRARMLRLQKLEAELARIAGAADEGVAETCQVLAALADGAPSPPDASDSGRIRSSKAA